jgi:2-C-methyl-D-erythritol 4-phosphate cytidylyltransferase
LFGVVVKGRGTSQCVLVIIALKVGDEMQRNPNNQMSLKEGMKLFVHTLVAHQSHEESSMSTVHLIQCS